MNKTQRIVSKHALILMGRGEKEVAAQVFVYDHIREIRADVEKLEVRLLMDYDKNYHRVFKVEVNENITKDHAIKLVIDFYNKLLNASMKLSDEERENLLNQRKEQFEKIKEAQDAAEKEALEEKETKEEE